MAHANARLTPAGRLTLVQRISVQPRRPIAHIAHEMGISRTTAYRWWGRYQQLGQAGLVDRPSIPLRSPRRTTDQIEQRILRLRREVRELREEREILRKAAVFFARETDRR